MPLKRIKLGPLGTIDWTDENGEARSVAPGASTTGLPSEVVAMASTAWTAQVVADYAATTAMPVKSEAEVNELAKEECSRRIYSVISAATQMNLAHVRDGLTGADATMYAAGMAWIVAMRAAWRTMAANSIDPRADASWPSLPVGFAAWIANY